MKTKLRGISVSPGAVVAPIVWVAPPIEPDADEPPTTNADDAEDVVRAALRSVTSRLRELSGQLSGDEAAVVETTIAIAEDPGLRSAIRDALEQGFGLTQAVAHAVEHYCRMLEDVGGYFAERVTDVRDVGDRIIAYLLKRPEPGIPTLVAPCIIAAQDLTPSQTVTLDRRLCKGIVTIAGGPTSHTAILARQRGIPAIVQVKGLDEVPQGTRILLDAAGGDITVNPSPEVERDIMAGNIEMLAAIDSLSGPGETRDGRPVALLANIGNIEDAKEAMACEREGIGLFRTEFLFMGRESAPSVSEQIDTYTQVLQAFSGKKVVVRVLDTGADKPLSFANPGSEENPALGMRGIRFLQEHPDLVRGQLEALAVAQENTDADLRVMAPMVATVDECEWFVSEGQKYGLSTLGAMIEVPAAALRSASLLEYADFLSIGTNDLSQYAMATDRMEGRLAHLLSPWQPAVLMLIDIASRSGITQQREVGVCGEAAANPLLALVLVGLGITSLSMASGSIPAVRYALSLHTSLECAAIADAALAAPTAELARAAALEKAHPEMVKLL